MFEVKVHTCSLCDKTQPERHCTERDNSRKSRSINERGRERERERKGEGERETEGD